MLEVGSVPGSNVGIGTRILVRNNTTLALQAHADDGGAGCDSTIVGSAEHREVVRLRRWRLGRRTREVDVGLRVGDETVRCGVRVTGGRFHSRLEQSIAGSGWTEGRQAMHVPLKVAGRDLQVTCRAVGAGLDDDIEVVVHDATEPQLGGDDTFDVLAWNVWLRPTPFFNAQATRAAELRRRLDGYDAVVLSETFHPRVGKQLLESLADVYPHQTRILGHLSGPWPLGRGLKLWNGGVVIASKWPIERTDECSFRGHLLPTDRYADKGAIYACINKGGTPYHLFGTHAQAEPEAFIRPIYRLLGRDPDVFFEEHRHRNYEVLAEFVESLHIPRDEPVLIVGDMNACKLGQAESYERMLDILDARAPDQATGHAATFCPPTNPLAAGSSAQWLDHLLWSRSHLQPTEASMQVRLLRSANGWLSRLGRRFFDLSDHYPVIGRFKFAR